LQFNYCIKVYISILIVLDIRALLNVSKELELELGLNINIGE